MPSAIPCSLSPFITDVHFSFFLDWMRTVSSKFFDTQVLSVFIRNLCSFVMLAVSSLIYAATDTVFYQTLISVGMAESRISPAASSGTCPRTPLISFCIVQLRTLCIARLLATLCLSSTSGPGPGELPSLWGSMVFHHAFYPSEGVG